MAKPKSPPKKPEKWVPINMVDGATTEPSWGLGFKSGEDGVVYRRSFAQKPARGRKISARQDAATEKKIRAVVAHRQRWPESKRQLDDRQQARLLEEELRQTVGYDEETMRKIIVGAYRPMKRLGIEP